MKSRFILTADGADLRRYFWIRERKDLPPTTGTEQSIMWLIFPGSRNLNEIPATGRATWSFRSCFYILIQKVVLIQQSPFP